MNYLKYININEDINRKYGKSNIFSEWHRKLGNDKYMIDIDGLYWDNVNQKIVVILEDKYYFKGLKHSNLLDAKNWMKQNLNIFTTNIHATLVFHEISSRSWYYIKNNDIIKNDNIPSALKKYEFINTENKLYLEIPRNIPSAIMYIKNEIPNYIIDYLSYYYNTIEIEIPYNKDYIIIDGNIIDSIESMKNLYIKNNYFKI